MFVMPISFIERLETFLETLYHPESLAQIDFTPVRALQKARVGGSVLSSVSLDRVIEKIKKTN